VGTQRNISDAFLALQVAVALGLAALLGAERSFYALGALLVALLAIGSLVAGRRRTGDDATSAPKPALKPSSEPLRRELEREGVERLAGGVARSFDDLLTTIGASTWMAEHAVSSGGSPQAALKEARDAVERASELTRQLSAFAGRLPLTKRRLDLNELVGSLEGPFERLLDEGSRLSLELCAEPLPLLADAAQLRQIIANLVLNARDALAPGGQIEIATSRNGEHACLEVRDDGTGLSAEAREHSFEPFFTTKAQGRGIGLGLSTCLGIVRQHEGSMQLDSALGCGTVARVLLPLATIEPGVTTSGVVPIAARRPRVLVAEDEPQVRAVAVRALSGAGFEVLPVANGALALAAIKSQREPFDVLVTDVLMPKLSGPELARTARSIDPSLGLVFMSGYPESMLGARVNEFAGAAFLAKPFTARELIEAVRERAERRSAELRAHG